jgi:methionine-rich copper-binding protein CopC
VTARVLLRLSGALVLAALSGALLGPLPAAAHTTLKQSDPAANSTVPVLPEVVRLTFSDTLPIVPKVTVSDPDGTEVNSSPISPRGNTVLQPVKSTKTGLFTVKWELTAADGHKSSGTFTFTVVAAQASPTAPVVSSVSSSPADAPRSSAVAGPATVATAAAATADLAEKAAESTKSGGSGLVWIVVIVALVVVAGGTAFFLRRRRQN